MSRFSCITFILLQSLIYGIGNPFSKLVYSSGLSPLWCLTIRFALAAFILALITGRKVLAELRRASVKSWLLPSLCMGGGYISCNIALKLTSATAAGFLMSLPVIFVPFLALPILHRRYCSAFLPAHIAALAGLYLLCCSTGRFMFGWGELAAILGSVLIAASLVWSEDCLRELSPLTISLAQIVVSGLLSFGGALCFEPCIAWTDFSPLVWGMILYMAILCSCIAYWLQNAALRHIPSGLVSLTQCTEPIFTAIVSYLALKERLTPAGWLGAALLMVCILYGNWAEMRHLTTARLPE